MLPWQPFLAFYIWGAHWRYLKNTTEPSMCGDDAALCQITLTTCFFCYNFFPEVAQNSPRIPWVFQVSRFFQVCGHPEHSVEMFLSNVYIHTLEVSCASCRHTSGIARPDDVVKQCIINIQNHILRVISHHFNYGASTLHNKHRQVGYSLTVSHLHVAVNSCHEMRQALVASSCVITYCTCTVRYCRPARHC